MNLFESHLQNKSFEADNRPSLDHSLGYWRVETAVETKAEHGISDRSDGNMCFYQDNGVGVVENRKNFFVKAGIDPRRVVMPDVVHGSDVAVITEDDLGKGVLDLQGALRVDGVISYLSDSTLAVDTGDCPVILFSDREGKMTGLAHAGWRSLDGGIITNMLEKIKEKILLDQISITIGVGICEDCYRFPENTDHPLLSNANWEEYKIFYQDGSVSIDLNAYIKDSLKLAGVSRENIKISESACSCHSKDQNGQNLFYSHRRASNEGGDSAQREGRFLTFIHLPEQEKQVAV